jgi:hypothetical protein
LHSHGAYPAFFSATDDRDEAHSFRLFAVIGHTFQKPQIRLRAGIFGYFWEIDPKLVLEIPEGCQSCSNSEAEIAGYDYIF